MNYEEYEESQNLNLKAKVSFAKYKEKGTIVKNFEL